MCARDLHVVYILIQSTLNNIIVLFKNRALIGNCTKIKNVAPSYLNFTHMTTIKFQAYHLSSQIQHRYSSQANIHYLHKFDSCVLHILSLLAICHTHTSFLFFYILIRGAISVSCIFGAGCCTEIIIFTFSIDVSQQNIILLFINLVSLMWELPAK